MKKPLFVLLFALINCWGFTQTTRLENEVKLDIPVQVSDSVWNYIVATYNNSDLGYETSVAVEHFFDQYYDTPGFKLLKNNDCVRYRKRTYVDGKTKELIQIKTDATNSDGLVRSETKFKPKNIENKKPELKNLIKKKDFSDFEEILTSISIKNYKKLQPTVVLIQNRSRVYLSKNNSSIATLTFDKVTAESGAKSVKFIEMELELNEKAYTAANDSIKNKMEKITAEIKANLLAQFPIIKVDQTPKYVKAAHLLKMVPKEIKTSTRIFKYTLPIVFLVILFFVIALIRKNKK